MHTRRTNYYYNNEELQLIRLGSKFLQINKTSKYPIHLLCIDQKFTVNYVHLYLHLQQTNIPNDVIFYIFGFVFSDILCTAFTEATTYPTPSYRSFSGANFFLTIDNDFKVCPSSTHGHNCNYYCAKKITGSLYCSVHMNCSVCKFNRRFEECIHSANKLCSGKYKSVSEIGVGMLSVNCDDNDPSQGIYNTRYSKYSILDKDDFQSNLVLKQYYHSGANNNNEINEQFY